MAGLMGESAKLFLGGLAPGTTKEDLVAHFSQFGEICDSVVMQNRGFGFVTFTSEEAQSRALTQAHYIGGRQIDVKAAIPQGQIDPTRSTFAPSSSSSSYALKPPAVLGPDVFPPAPAAPAGGAYVASGGGGVGRVIGPSPKAGPVTDKIFVGGLPQNCSEDALREYFQVYGNIIDSVVMKEKVTGKPRGFGFVQYDNTESVDQVMQGYASHTIEGKWVEVKRATPQDQMPVSAAPGMMRGAAMGGGAGKGCLGWKGRGAGFFGGGGYGAGCGYGAGGGYGGSYGVGKGGYFGMAPMKGYGCTPPAQPFFSFSGKGRSGYSPY